MQANNPDFIVVDLFCGAGGTTIGMEDSDGVAKVIAAVNHDPKAIESHWKNHPEVVHFEEDIRTLDLTGLINVVHSFREKYPKAMLILWASLECTNFSKAKGGQPRNADSRTLAEHLYRYITALNPQYIMIENVVEFMSWGPLDANGKPLSKRAGADFIKWQNHIMGMGYAVQWQELNSADFGARTSRNRLFGCFAQQGLPIKFPEPTHAKKAKSGMFGVLQPHQACRPCLDLEEKGSSIFTPGKIRSEKTFERIFAGLIKYVAGANQKEFISKYFSGRPEGKNISIDGPAGTIKTIDGQALVQAEFLLKYNSMAIDGNMRHSTMGVDSPAPTITAQRQPNIVQAEFISNYYSSGDNNHGIDKPAPTLRTGDGHSLVQPEWIDRQFGNGTKHSSIDDPMGAVMPNPKASIVHAEFIMDTQFNNIGNSTSEPFGTITANRKWHYLVNPQYFNSGGSIDSPCFTLIARMDKAPPYIVEVEGGHLAIEVYESDSPTVRKIKMFMAMYGLKDVKMRMLKVVELKRIQGFPEDYILCGNQADQKKFIGNSVHPIIPKVWIKTIKAYLK